MPVGLTRYSRDQRFSVIGRNRAFLLLMPAGSIVGTVIGGLLLGIVPVAVMPMSVVLIAGPCVLAYALAVYALLLMLGLTTAQFACHTDAGLIGAGLVGLVAAVAAFGVLALLLDALHSPILRIIVALVLMPASASIGPSEIVQKTRESPRICRQAKIGLPERQNSLLFQGRNA